MSEVIGGSTETGRQEVEIKKPLTVMDLIGANRAKGGRSFYLYGITYNQGAGRRKHAAEVRQIHKRQRRHAYYLGMRSSKRR